MPSGLDRGTERGIDNHVLSSTQMNFVSRIHQMTGHFNMLTPHHLQRVISTNPGVARSMGQVMFIGLQLMAGKPGHQHAALVVDLNRLVVEHQLGPVPLRADGDFFAAFGVFDAQLVVAAATWAAVGFEQGLGFLRGQL